MLSLVTGPAVEPLTVADVKLHLKVDHTTEDALIANLITAGRQYVENFTHRALITQTWDDYREGFPCGAMELPMPPAISVTSVTYLDTAGASQTWSSALYDTDLPVGPYAMPARIRPIYGGTYPSTRDSFRAVTIRFVCGYGAAASSVPVLIRSALLLLIGWMYDHRQACVAEGDVSSADRLLWPFKVVRGDL